MKFLSRLLIFGFILAELLRRKFRRSTADGILLTHNFLLGDTLMLTPLMKRSLGEFHNSYKYILCRPAFKELIELNGMGYTPLVYDLRNPNQILKTIRVLRGRISKALILGDARYSLLAFACGAQSIIAESPEKVFWKKVAVTDWVHFMPKANIPWSDQIADCFFPTTAARSDPSDWPRIDSRNLVNENKTGRLKVLVHLGASTPLKQWSPKNWNAVISYLLEKKFEVLISVGPGETHLLDELQFCGGAQRVNGDLSLVAIARLMATCDFIVSVDTGIAHLAKIVHRPAIVLYGPAQALLHQPGDYWGPKLQTYVSDESVACRDQHVFFKKEIPWIKRCSRTVDTCPTPGMCINAITPAVVIDEITKIRCGLENQKLEAGQDSSTRWGLA